MTNVVEFPGKEPDDLIWTCAECSCVTFKLHIDGSVSCAHCGKIDDGGYWFDPSLRSLSGTPVVPEATKEVVDFNSNAATFRNTLREIEAATADGIFALIYVKHDGYVSSWGPHGNRLTDDQRQWAAGRFTHGLNILLMPEFADEPANT